MTKRVFCVLLQEKKKVKFEEVHKKSEDDVTRNEELGELVQARHRRQGQRRQHVDLVEKRPRVLRHHSSLQTRSD